MFPTKAVTVLRHSLTERMQRVFGWLPMLLLRNRVNEKTEASACSSEMWDDPFCDLVDPGGDYAGYCSIGPIVSMIGFLMS